MSILVLTGRLSEDARCACTTDGQHIVSAEFALPTPAVGRAVLVRIKKAFGSGNAAGYAASARARQLRRGVLVQVGCNRVGMSRGGLLLSDLDYLHTPDIKLDYRTGTNDD